MVNVNRPTAVAGEADIVSSVSASPFHIGGPIGVNPGELALVYGSSTQNFGYYFWFSNYCDWLIYEKKVYLYLHEVTWETRILPGQLNDSPENGRAKHIA